MEQSVPKLSAPKIQTPGESPKRNNKTLRTRRKFEIKKNTVEDWISLVWRARQSLAVMKKGMKIHT